MDTWYDVTVDCDKDTAKIYEWARGETDEDGQPVNPLRFPLEGCMVIHNGSRARITIDRPGRSALIIDRLIQAPEPTQNGRDGRSWTLSGRSERLYNQNVKPEDCEVSFTLKEVRETARLGSRA